MPLTEELTRAFVTLFVIIDPIGTVPIYLSLVGGLAFKAQRVVILWTLLFMITLLSLANFFGATFISYLSITPEAFSIAGGIFLFWTAFEMLFEKRDKRRRKAAETKDVSNIELRSMAISPMCIPLLAGPGTITATIILSNEAGSMSGKFYLMGVIASVVIIVGILLLLGSLLSKYIDDTFRIFASRFMGLLLGALAVQMIVNAILKLSAI